MRAFRTEQGTEVRPGPHWNARTRATLLASHEMMVNLALHVLMAGAHAHLRGEARSQASRSIRQVRRGWEQVLTAYAAESGDD